VTVPPFAEGLTLSVPMFPVPAAGRVVAPLRSSKRPPIKIPFYLDSERFIPEAAPALSLGRSREACVFVWGATRTAGALLEVKAELSRQGEPSLPVRIDGAPRVLSDADGFDRYVVNLAPSDVPPGPYRLRLTFTDPATGVATRSETGVVIRR
jgi:hypothetical protein